MAGQPSNPLSVNQTKQYGDETALDRMRKTTTTTPMTGTTVPAPTAGRPRGSAQQTPAQAPQAAAQIDPQHQSAMSELAQAARTREFWNNVLAQYPSEWSRMYAADANARYRQLAQQVRDATPFFEVWR